MGLFRLRSGLWTRALRIRCSKSYIFSFGKVETSADTCRESIKKDPRRSLRIDVEDLFYLYSDGVFPKCFLNADVKRLCPENPTSEAISPMLLSVFFKSSAARSILCSLT